MAAPNATDRPPLSTVRAWSYLGINLLATPGMGSVMGGRKVVGRGQLVFSVTGFCLIVMWIFKVAFASMESQISETAAPLVPAWWWESGVVAFGIGWLWSFVTSIAMVLEARAGSGKLPPKLGGVGKPIPPKL